MKKNQKIFVFLFFIIYLIIGLFIYDDYGISYDENTQREQNGEVVFNFITQHNNGEYARNPEKYHGPAFEVLLIAVEKLFQLKNRRNIFLLRHLLTFLTFYTSVIFFFLLAKAQFKNAWIALAGCVFLVLSPRIFADSFYNSKDLPFLSVFIICMFTFQKYRSNKNILFIFIHALACGLLTGIRITGTIVPVITLIWEGVQIVSRMLNKGNLKAILIRTSIYSVFQLIFILLCWPILWLNPLGHFISAWKEARHFDWTGQVLYMGEQIMASQLPWHYLPVWLLITTPVQYIIIFFIGTFFIVKGILSKQFHSLKQTDHLINIAFLFIPVCSVIFFHSTVYDAWRHVFFVYVPFLLIGLHGLKGLLEFGSQRYALQVIIILCISACSLITLTTMVKQHPYQYVYFNKLAGSDLSKIKFKYELDYWGVSFKQLYEKMLKELPDDTLYILPHYPPEIHNLILLPPLQASRVVITYDTARSKYILSNYRWIKSDTLGKPVCSIDLENVKISGAYLFKSNKSNEKF